jgi:hypothetical protein
MSSDRPAAEDGAEGPSGASEAAESAGAAKALDPKRKKQLMTAGVAVGIGSAAIVAALLYTNRSKRHEKGNG